MPCEGAVRILGKRVVLYLGQEADIEVMQTDVGLVMPTEDSSRYFLLLPEPNAAAEEFLKQQDGSSVASCKNCDDSVTQADWVCLSCKETLCRECDDVIHRRKTVRGHTRIQLTGVAVAFHSRPAAKLFKDSLSGDVAITSTPVTTVPAPSTPVSAPIIASSPPKEPVAEVEGEAGQIELFARKMEELVGVLDGPEMARKIADKIRLEKHSSQSPEMELVVRDLCEKVFDKSSATLGVLKCIHQRIVLSTAFHLKQTVMQGLFTSDIRSSDGWKVVVEVSDVIKVTHIRREQSMAVAPETQQFVVEYTVTLVLDRTAQHLCATTLRISGLEFGPKVSSEFRYNLNARLGSGNLLVQ